MVVFNFVGDLWEFRGLTPVVGATLVVALVWAGTRPAPTGRSLREIPMTQTSLFQIKQPIL